MLHTPPWVRYHDAGRLHFLWDDALGGAHDLGNDTPTVAVLRTAQRIEPRARLALAVALTEWVVWRFEGLHNRPEPGAFIEAAWCATADPRYLRLTGLSRGQWRGPVEGPLWRAMARLRQAIAVGLESPGELQDALSYLTRLATHVQPSSGPLMAWLPLVLDRLALVYPVMSEEVGPSSFEGANGLATRLGPWVAREVFDLAIPVDGNTGRAFLEGVLATARREENPFLSTPAELVQARFKGTPYELRLGRPQLVATP